MNYKLASTRHQGESFTLIYFSSEMVQLVKDAGKSALGQYISSIHEYWKNAPSNLRDQYRLQLLRNIDSLNVSISKCMATRYF